MAGGIDNNSMFGRILIVWQYEDFSEEQAEEFAIILQKILLK